MSSQSANSQTVDLVARGLDVGARGIDLISTAATLINSQNGAVRLTSNLIYWLGRERIGTDDLDHCFSRAQNLVRLNAAGLNYCKDVVQELEVKDVTGPFSSVKSGCLGRTLLRDPALAWITTTIANLYQFHNEAFVTYVTSRLIIRVYEEKGGMRTTPRTNHWSDPQFLRMHQVISKVAYSIWLNIVNAQCKNPDGHYAKMPLPEEIQSVCRQGHLLDSEDLVEAIARLKNPHRSPQIIIQSRFILSNLCLWLLYHFDGLLRVVVNNKIVYENVGGEKQEIELRVHERCHSDEACENVHRPTDLVMIDKIANRFQQFFTPSSSSRTGPTENTSPARRELYEFRSGQGINALNSVIKAVTSNLVCWLCSLRVKISPKSSSEIIYDVNLSQRQSSQASEIIMADLLKRSPSILQYSWAPELAKNWEPETAQDIWSPAGFSRAKESFKGFPKFFEKTDSAQRARMPIVWECYPGLADVVERAQRECRCVPCQENKTPAFLQSGCLRSYTYLTVLSLIGHAIADAFGADDLSGAKETSQPQTTLDVYSVERILLEIATQARVSWQTWFEAASFVFLGRHSHNLGARQLGDGIQPADDSMAIAMQYGDLAVVAPWIDLSQEISHRGSFGFIPVQGRLCVSTRGDLDNYQLLDAEFAVVKSKGTEQSSDESNESSTVPPSVDLEIDHSHIEFDNFLAPSEHEFHFLLNRVRVGQFSRIINPCIAVVEQLKQSQIASPSLCGHGIDQIRDQLPATVHESVSIHTFEGLLGAWPTGNLQRIDVSQVLESNLKCNIALALTQGGNVIVNDGRCWTCSVNKLQEVKGRRLRSSVGRYVINTSKGHSGRFRITSK